MPSDGYFSDLDLFLNAIDGCPDEGAMVVSVSQDGLLAFRPSVGFQAAYCGEDSWSVLANRAVVRRRLPGDMDRALWKS